ncbi:plant expansin [Coniophora puteana RWD-64-598 SS2]|uniref:Plant expansin n=1 Tax=Coniophora puteana (strain RWD-64-598) TaxID=741705 RepID=A0A5M3N166_CONPW|nr:plant expansin [Coniophora puteana RWD-64-598 SS2]EIW85139.1 plant expansin [Coniophora puteana RWD-64-598 SS2]
MFSTLVVALSALSVVSARAVYPRATPPAGWATDYLEPYDNYHCRYLAIQCQYQHNTQFFTDCCHPLLATQDISSRPAQCQLPANVTCEDGRPSSSGSSSAPVPSPTSSDDDGCGDDEPTSTPNFGGVPTASSSSAPAPTTSSVWTPPPSSSSSPAWTPAPSSTSSSPAWTPAPSSTSSAQPSPTSGGGDSGTNSGGFATYFYQNGDAGACGTVHSDSDFIAAIDQDRYGNSGATSSLCGQQVQITNTDNGNQVTVTIADDCPTCTNGNSIDLSVGAFQALDALSVGEVPITWTFLN